MELTPKLFVAECIRNTEEFSTKDKITMLEHLKIMTSDEVESVMMAYEDIENDLDSLTTQEAIQESILELKTPSFGDKPFWPGLPKDPINDLFRKKESFSTKGAVIGAGAAVLAALIARYAYQKYKDTYSKAAKACSKKTGAAKQECMLKFRKDAIKKQIATLNSERSKCKKSKDPAKCQALLKKKADKLKKKMAKL